MNKTIKRQWIKALRSGKYRQGHNSLATWDQEAQAFEYCCLGVLCEIAIPGEWVCTTAPDQVDKIFKRGSGKVDYNYVTDDGHTDSAYLPHPIAAKLHLDDEVEVYKNGLGVSVMDTAQHHLAALNDRPRSFDDIADWIEANL